MNSLRVDGVFVVVFLRNGHGSGKETIGLREERCCRHLRGLAWPIVSGQLVGASYMRIQFVYNPLYPIVSVHFPLPPRFTARH